eukprot:gnl/TRDRNA2_/TRDRNA2_51645_c0_seq1.p1 gnl/TRDRNA2_/TRDRNA2_51645_c0~~gnl/TRDRNA2_/TRDRNA2_51645_c0_seq1.p1  ORF type:complete len:331 (+),score=56.86 gnl/TRDRNA2_/TRDRNA2_51645_c0_seq1:84-995(+)
MYASEELRADRDVVSAAVNQNGHALIDIAEHLKQDRDIVLAAVKQNGEALMYAAEDLTADREVVLAAVRQNGSALLDAADALQADPEVKLTARVSELEAQVRNQEARIQELEKQLVQAHDSIGSRFSFQKVLPCTNSVSELLKAVPSFQPGSHIDVPVWELRLTHNAGSGRLAAAIEDEQSQELIFTLLKQLMSNRITSLEVTRDDPLNVFVHRGPDGGALGLYCRQNERLTALLMFQARHREQVVFARCRVRMIDEPHTRQASDTAMSGQRAIARYLALPERTASSKRLIPGPPVKALSYPF